MRGNKVFKCMVSGCNKFNDKYVIVERNYKEQKDKIIGIVESYIYDASSF